ncbi:hypothetical protein ACFWCB_12985 [Streptomyces sp. NPDC060048]|uniref:ATP-dependent DNA ligase n=1 Tax=unclassified Streptomyces TaxID=2593676 RepID=UPI0036804864
MPGSRRRARGLGDRSRSAVLRALQCRTAARGRTITALAAKSPAFFIAFDALQVDGVELLALPYVERRRRLEVMFAARTLTALGRCAP